MSTPPLPEDLKRCVEFHGHLCPGVTIGYRAALEGLERLAATRAGDEELIAIVENDSCAVDAVQLLTGCTFGKGNLFFRDYGKMVFTFALRPDGRSVRLSYKRPAAPGMEDVPEQDRRMRQIEFMLSQPVSVLFDVRESAISLPEKASIRETVKCDVCGEGVMATRAHTEAGRNVCIPCGGDTRAAVVYEPIGVIRSEHCVAKETPIQPIYAEGCKGRAEVYPAFADGLRDLEGFSHVYLVYHFHRAGPARLTVKPFLQDVERGVFSTRAPCRPNAIGLSIVELVGREGNVLHLNGLDVLDGTPLLDIKPYTARFDRLESTRNGWQDDVDDDTARHRGKRGYRQGTD